MNEYWISWSSIMEDDGGFELRSPWWVSGWNITKDNKEESIFVGAIRADSEEEAWKKIAEAYDTPPENGVNQRFIQVMSGDEERPWEREGTRFPLGDWMEW